MKLIFEISSFHSLSAPLIFVFRHSPEGTHSPHAIYDQLLQRSYGVGGTSKRTFSRHTQATACSVPLFTISNFIAGRFPGFHAIFKLNLRLQLIQLIHRCTTTAQLIKIAHSQRTPRTVNSRFRPNGSESTNCCIPRDERGKNRI